MLGAEFEAATVTDATVIKRQRRREIENQFEHLQAVRDNDRCSLLPVSATPVGGAHRYTATTVIMSDHRH
jgi:hypothetical protein